MPGNQSNAEQLAVHRHADWQSLRLDNDSILMPSNMNMSWVVLQLGVQFDSKPVTSYTHRCYEHGQINTSRPKPLRSWRSFKVTNFGINGNPVCNFLCMNTCNLPPILHRFRDMAYFFQFSPSTGVSLFNALVGARTPKFQDCEIWRQNN